MADVHRAMDMLKVMEVQYIAKVCIPLVADIFEIRWHIAGRLWDMLYELAVVSELPLPSSSYAAVIRSIKQNRRQPSRPTRKSVSEVNTFGVLHRSIPRFAPTAGSSAMHNHSSMTSQDRHVPVLDINTYQSDPVPPWC